MVLTFIFLSIFLTALIGIVYQAIADFGLWVGYVFLILMLMILMKILI